MTYNTKDSMENCRKLQACVFRSLWPHSRISRPDSPTLLIFIIVSVWSMDVIKLSISGNRYHFACCYRQRLWELATCSVVSMVHWSARQTRSTHVLSPRWHSLIYGWNTQPARSVITWTQRRLEKRLDPASDRCFRNFIYSYFKMGIL
jgi:hypothetical protein